MLTKVAVEVALNAELEVHLVSSDAAPGGAGELATPLVAPAIANAVFSLSGKQLRSLPFSDHAD